MVIGGYAPDLGDIVWLQFDPRAEHEQAGHCSALVLTPERYNRLRGTMIYCPMTSRIKGYPFEVIESRDPPSAVLADQVKSLDWRARNATLKSRISPAALAEVQGKIRALMKL